ncbi:MAG TPA: hypothetical protein VMF59_13565 [Bacteroidota bacterium]|nr:hypothetical protein [Bacteroidota bacterium]
MSTASAQAIFSPRASALGAYGPLVRDARGFTANPSGLVGMKDWDIYTSTYTAPSISGGGLVFSGFGIGKRFFANNALAFQYTPGTSLDVIEPAHFTIAGLSISTDREETYTEPLAAAYAYRFSEKFSAGIQARLRTEKITETVFSPLPDINDSLNAVVPVQQQYTRSTWFADIGVLWKPVEALSLSALGRGLVQANGSGIPSTYDSYTLPRERFLEVGAAWSVTPFLTFAAQGSTDRRGSLGVEWAPGLNIAARGGLYADGAGSPFIDAVGIGIGWSYLFLEADASYIRFTNQSGRKGAVNVPSFDPSGIKDIGMSPFSPDRASVSIRAMLGSVREIPVRIEGVEMLSGVYPSSYQALAYRPIGKVRVRNNSQKPVQARAQIFVAGLMDQPTESRPVSIGPGATGEIPLTAVFNDRIKTVPSLTIREGAVSVSADPSGDDDDRVQARVLIHGKNDWDGSAGSLRYFVTPDDPEIIRTAREILLANKDSLEGVPADLGPLRRASILCDAFRGKLVYVRDPRHLTEFVQYSTETLRSQSGDCTDMTVCFASLLSSMGIATAFVDVVPPLNPEKAHIFLLFDTGVSPAFGDRVSSNPKRYVVRKSKSGRESIWLPVESTAITRGFETAWTEGAQEYFDDVELGLGLVQGWVRIVDVY